MSLLAASNSSVVAEANAASRRTRPGRAIARSWSAFSPIRFVIAPGLAGSISPRDDSERPRLRQLRRWKRRHLSALKSTSAGRNGGRRQRRAHGAEATAPTRGASRRDKRTCPCRPLRSKCAMRSYLVNFLYVIRCGLVAASASRCVSPSRCLGDVLSEAGSYGLPAWASHWPERGGKRWRRTHRDKGGANVSRLYLTSPCAAQRRAATSLRSSGNLV